MEFLSLEENLYSDGKKGKSNKDNVNIILSVVGQGLEVKEQTDLNNFVGGLTEEHKTYFSKVIKSKSTDQEKAIISALLNKYPKLKNNEAQQREFREHLENMLDTGKVKSGALKYLLERLLEVDKKKKEEEQAEAEAEAEEQQAPEGGAPEGGEEAQEAAAEPQAADTENSYLEEDKEYAMKFNKEEILARREAYGTLLGALIGAITELYKLKNLPGKSKINKEFKSLHKSLSTETMNGEQREALSKLVGILKSNKPISTAESYYYKITPLFSREQSRDLRYLIRLGADSKGVKVPSFSKLLVKTGSGAISGLGVASMTRGSNAQYSDMDFYSEWEKEFNNTECELTEDDFNDKIDYDEVDEYLQFPSRERMSSEYLKNNPMNKAEKFLDSKRKEKSPEDSGYSSLMVAEDFILSRKIAKDSTYGYVKSGIVGGLAGTAIGAGIGHVSTLKDKRLAKENAQKYAANKEAYMKAKAKTKKLLNKSGFNYNDQREAKALNKELSKLKRSHIYTPEQEKELAELKSKLQAVESMESTARSVNTLAHNNPLGKLAANAAISLGSNAATTEARSRMAKIKAQGKLAAQAKYEEKLKELKKLNSKKNFTDEDKEKYDRLRKFIKDHKNTGRRAAFHDAKRRGAMRAGITSGMAIGTAAGLGRELYKQDFKD